jgi:hypothetical protein
MHTPGGGPRSNPRIHLHRARHLSGHGEGRRLERRPSAFSPSDSKTGTSWSDSEWRTRLMPDSHNGMCETGQRGGLALDGNRPNQNRPCTPSMKKRTAGSKLVSRSKNRQPRTACHRGDHHCNARPAGSKIHRPPPALGLAPGQVHRSDSNNLIRKASPSPRKDRRALPRKPYATLFRPAKTSRKLFNPASRFSMISSASSSGSGKLSRSVRLLSLSQKTSRLVLSRAVSSS